MSQTCLFNFFYKRLPDFYKTNHYRGHSAIVWHNTNLATVHSRVTVDGCSMEYDHKLLRQFTTTLGGTRCCL